MDIKQVYKDLDIEYIPSNETYDQKVAICISGEYRTFDFCKHIMKENILNHLNNYHVFILLSDDNDTEDHTYALQEFFGKNLICCLKSSSFPQKVKDEEENIYTQYRQVTNIPAIQFNTKAQYRRYILNNIKNQCGQYEYTLILRFDVFYMEAITFNFEGIYGHNDVYFLGKSILIDRLLNEIGPNYMQYVNECQLPVEKRCCPERIYLVIINKFTTYTSKYMCMYVRYFNNNYTQNFESIKIQNVYVIRPNFKKLPDNFDVNCYKQNNADLAHMSSFELKKHYIEYGINENRNISKNFFDAFIYCGAKSGSSTLKNTMVKNGYKCMHVHSEINFLDVYKSRFGEFPKISLKEFINQHDNQLIIIDVYRNPIERAVSSLFHHSKTLVESPLKREYKDISISLYQYILNKNTQIEDYHPLDTEYKVFEDVPFLNKYITKRIDNKLFIKLRFKDIHLWSDYLSEILGKNITIFNDNISDNKEYGYYLKYVKDNMKISQSLFDKVKDDPMFKKYNSEEEQQEYLNKWLSRVVDDSLLVELIEDEDYKNVPSNFNAIRYQQINVDLEHLSVNELKFHYEYYGHREHRQYA